METHEYWTQELNHFTKAYEVNFTHFMGTFYFWTGIMTLPATAGLLAKDTIMTPIAFSSLFGLLAILGIFLTAKMYDIRCSQLKYIHFVDHARHYLYKEVKTRLPKEYKHPFDTDNNLWHIALTDFGMIMAIVMSLVNAAYAACCILFLGTDSWWRAATVFLVLTIFGIGLYALFVFRKVPSPQEGTGDK